MKSTSSRNEPPMVAPMSIMVVLEAVNDRMRSRRKSNIGHRVRCSHQMKAG